MKKILVIVASTGVAVAIAIAARNQLASDDEAYETQIVSRVQARPALGNAVAGSDSANVPRVAEEPDAAQPAQPGPRSSSAAAPAAPASAAPAPAPAQVDEQTDS